MASSNPIGKKVIYHIVHPAADVAARFRRNEGFTGAAQVLNTLVMPTRRDNADVYEKLRAAASPLTFTGKLRLFDIVGSSNDLPQWQLIFTSLPLLGQGLDIANPFGKWGRGLPTLSACSSNLPVTVEVTAARDPRTIVLNSADYNISGETWNFKQNPKVPIGNMGLAAFYILGNIYGLRGIEVTVHPTSPIGKGAGLESSNAYVYALCWLGTVLSGSGHGPGQLFSQAVHTANYALGDGTGGQGISAMMLGGYHSFRYLVQPGMLGFIAHEVVSPSGYANINDHIDLVQPGKDFGKKSDRRAVRINDAWCAANTSLDGFTSQSEIPGLGIEFAEALRDATVNKNESAWGTAVNMANKQTDIRQQLSSLYFEGNEQFVASVRQMGGAAFALGAGGKGAMFAVLGPRGLTKAVREKFGLEPITDEIARKALEDGGFLKGYVPYEIDKQGMTWSNGFEKAGFGPIPESPLQVTV